MSKGKESFVLHRKCFSNLVYPSIWKSSAKISQFGLKIFLCVIWHILQLSKNFNQFQKNLFRREWSNNYTSKSNSPFDRKKLTWRIGFAKKGCFQSYQFSISGENWVFCRWVRWTDMNHFQTFFPFLALSSQTRCICPKGKMYLSKLQNVFVQIVDEMNRMKDNPFLFSHSLPRPAAPSGIHLGGERGKHRAPKRQIPGSCWSAAKPPNYLSHLENSHW